MSYQFTIYAIPAIIGAIVECTLAVVAWRRRSTRGAPQFAVLMACCGLASFMSIFGLSAVDRNSLVVASMFGTVGLTAASPTFFLFAAHYSGVRWAQSTPVFWFLIAFLAAYLLMVLSDNVAGTQFLTRTLEFDRSGGFGAVVRTRGPVFAPAIAVFNVITISGIVMLVRAALIACSSFSTKRMAMRTRSRSSGIMNSTVYKRSCGTTAGSWPESSARNGVRHTFVTNASNFATGSEVRNMCSQAYWVTNSVIVPSPKSGGHSFS